MTSKIVSDTIDETFPVAGQDNDSQGFRDNFNIIKNGLATSASEISDLQNNTAKLNEQNNFNGTLIENAQTNRLYGTVYRTNTALSSTVTIDYTNGEYQVITVTRNCTLRFQNWPKRPDNEPVYAKLRLALIPDSATVYDVRFTTVNGSVRSQAPNPLINTKPDTEVATIVDVWTASDGTNNVYISVVGNFDKVYTLSSLEDVKLTTPTTGDFLKFIGGVWTNSSETPKTKINSLHQDILDVEMSTSTKVPNHGDTLVYDGASDVWTNEPLANQLNRLQDVTIATAKPGDVIRYTGIPDIPTSWRNEADPNLVQYNMFVQTYASAIDAFFFDALPSAGGIRITDRNATPFLLFHIGNTYRFNLDDISNQAGPLRFSTTKPSIRVTDYTNITINGVPGTVGSYVEILVTKDTPDTLYMYGVNSPAVPDAYQLGRDIPIIVNKTGYYTGSERLNGTNADLYKSVSYFETTTSSVATLGQGSEGQIKTFIMASYGGNMEVAVTGPGWSTASIGHVTFNAQGQSCTLQFINGKWYCIGNNGATFS